MTDQEKLREAIREVLPDLSWGSLYADAEGTHCRYCRAWGYCSRDVVHADDCPVTILTQASRE